MLFFISMIMYTIVFIVFLYFESKYYNDDDFYVYGAVALKLLFFTVISFVVLCTFFVYIRDAFPASNCDNSQETIKRKEWKWEYK